MMDLFGAIGFIVGLFLFVGHLYYGARHKDFSWPMFWGSSGLIIVSVFALLG